MGTKSYIQGFGSISFLVVLIAASNSAEMSGESLFEAALSNFRAIQSYDVRVSEWSNTTPHSADDLEIVPTTERSRHYRLIVDLKKESCLWIANEKVEFFGFDPKSKAPTMPLKKFAPHLASQWFFESFANGARIRRMLEENSIKDKVEKMELSSFWKSSRVPSPEFTGMLHYPCYQYAIRGYGFERIIAARAGSTVRILADGTCNLTEVNESPNSTFYVSRFYNPSNWMPISLSIALEKDGGSELWYSHRPSFELVGEIHRPIELSYSKDTKERGFKNGLRQEVQCDEVGTIRIEWLKMNDSSIEFPKIDSLARDLKLWNDFIGANDRPLKK